MGRDKRRVIRKRRGENRIYDIITQVGSLEEEVRNITRKQEEDSGVISFLNREVEREERNKKTYNSCSVFVICILSFFITFFIFFLHQNEKKREDRKKRK